jgi:hypothetical protein
MESGSAAQMKYKKFNFPHFRDLEPDNSGRCELAGWLHIET